LENILEYYLQIMDILKISYTETLTMPIKVRIALTKLLKEKENLVEDSLEMKKYQNLMDLISKGFSSVLEMLSKKGIF